MLINELLFIDRFPVNIHFGQNRTSGRHQFLPHQRLYLGRVGMGFDKDKGGVLQAIARLLGRHALPIEREQGCRSSKENKIVHLALQLQ